MLNEANLDEIKKQDKLKLTELSLLTDNKDGRSLRDHIEALCERAAAEVKDGAEIIVLSDQGLTGE